MNETDFIQWCATEVAPCVRVPGGYRRRPLVMGILNVTPDSFSDGGCFVSLDAARRRAADMVAAGADLLDIGGESSRPGSIPVSIDEELARVLPVVEALRADSDIALSVDTCKPEVMRAVVDAGATLINDIWALRVPGALAEIARLDVPVCLMHMQGSPDSMQIRPEYKDGVISTIQTFFDERIAACESAGIVKARLILDPGFGFGKTDEQNLLLTQQLSMFQSHELPVLFGASRKSTIGSILNQGIADRLAGGLGLAVFAALQGVSMIRTHDVAETRQAFDLVDAVIHVTHEGERV